MAENYLQKLRKVKAFFFDVDGVLSDGSVTLMPNGDQVRVMNVKDGYVLQLAVKLGYHVCIITGGKSDQVKTGCKALVLSMFIWVFQTNLNALMSIVKSTTLTLTKVYTWVTIYQTMR